VLDIVGPGEALEGRSGAKRSEFVGWSRLSSNIEEHPCSLESERWLGHRFLKMPSIILCESLHSVLFPCHLPSPWYTHIGVKMKNLTWKVFAQVRCTMHVKSVSPSCASQSNFNCVVFSQSLHWMDHTAEAMGPKVDKYYILGGEACPFLPSTVSFLVMWLWAGYVTLLRCCKDKVWIIILFQPEDSILGLLRSLSSELSRFVTLVFLRPPVCDSAQDGQSFTVWYCRRTCLVSVGSMLTSNPHLLNALHLVLFYNVH
jgi:hypothetical protein